MAIYIKDADAWVEVDKPYTKHLGVWKHAFEVWVKDGGQWVRAYEHDTTPSSAPEISLAVIDNRYIRVGAQLPGVHDPDVKRIRILASRNTMPTTQFGAGFIHEEDVDWKHEPWSDWYYNNSNPDKQATEHSSTDAWSYKQFPPNPGPKTDLPDGQHYYFAGWTEDLNGNWSVGTFARIWIPKRNTGEVHPIVKEARFQANAAGSAGLDGAGYTEGILIARDSPRKNGFWFHSTKMTQAIGEHGTPTIRSAQIRVTRGNDTGEPTANVNLFWHGVNGPIGMPLQDSGRMSVTKVGTINKNETKWFDLPTSYHSKLTTEIKGLGLSYGIQASDFMESPDLRTDPRNGEVHVVWEEAR